MEKSRCLPEQKWKWERFGAELNLPLRAVFTGAAAEQPSACLEGEVPAGGGEERETDFLGGEADSPLPRPG